jgi:hypothetical protein
MKNCLLLKSSGSILGAAMFALVGSAQAQTGPDRVTVQLSHGLQATVYAAVPDGFEPNTATAEELRYYGFPRRPDQSNPDALAAWVRAVHTTRVATDLVEKPGVFHSPLQKLTTEVANSKCAPGTSGNWSAGIDDGPDARFTEIIGNWAVPNVASEASGTANAYSSIWVGLDGNGTEDLIQDGTESDWVGDKATYDAWVEVLPAAEVVEPGLTVSPGDAIAATTAYEIVDGKPVAYFYLANLNTNKSISTTIAFPKTLTFTGQSAEWVVERTQVGGTFEHPLPRYGQAFMSTAFVFRDFSDTPIPAESVSASVATKELVIMCDVPTGTNLSEPEALGLSSFQYNWLKY